MDTPLWVLEPLSYDIETKSGDNKTLKVAMVIIELPINNTIAYLDMCGKFREAVVYQILAILRTLAGDLTSGVIRSTELKECSNLKDCDLSLVMFIKHYRGSTATVMVPNSDLSDIKESYISALMSELYANKFFKDSLENSSVSKIPMHLVEDSGMFFFAVCGNETTDIDETEIARVKSKIYVA